MDEDDSGDEDEDVDMVNVDFEWFNFDSEIDFHGVKSLLRQLLDVDSQLFDLSALSDLIITQNTLGSTVKVDGKETDAYAFLTILNLREHRDKKPVKDFTDYILQKSKTNPALASLSNVLTSSSSEVRTSRELKRLDSVSRSPIYAHFQETLGGITTIRAYREQLRFSKENEWRVDANLRAYFPSINANRWLAVRLEFLGSVIIFASAGFAIISVSSGTGLGPGTVGLAMSYALQITQSLNWIVRQTVEVETNIVSVERVLEYAALPSEAPEVIHRNRPPANWPARGQVTFNNFSTRYREGLNLVLKNINLDIKPHEKIGVVGRTGAGKSSLTLLCSGSSNRLRVISALILSILQQ